MTQGKYTVEFRADDEWGQFVGIRFLTAGEAVGYARACLVAAGPLGALYTAARVWEAGPSWSGDRGVWDSRD